MAGRGAIRVAKLAAGGVTKCGRGDDERSTDGGAPPSTCWSTGSELFRERIKEAAGKSGGEKLVAGAAADPGLEIQFIERVHHIDLHVPALPTIAHARVPERIRREDY